MRHLQITATAEQALLIDERLMDRGNVLKTAAYIPGASLRGAFAGDWHRMLGAEDQVVFDDAIVREQLAFGPLLPLAADEPGRATPVPVSIRACKLEKTRHPLHDLLFHEVQNCPKCEEKRARLEGSECGEKLARLEGFLLGSGGSHRYIKEPKKRLTTSVGLDNRLESAQEGQLFSRQVLVKGSQFRGQVFVADHLWDKLPRFASLRVGLAKTSGLGKLSLRWDESTCDQVALASRLEQMQASAKTWGKQLEADEQLVTLDLLSPLVLSDAFNNPRLQVQPTDLAPYGGDLSWRVLDSFGQITQIGGWYHLINRPKQHRPAVSAGSVIVLAVKGDHHELLQALQHLEHYGLGQGWGAGYGHLITNHPFHLNQDLHQEATP